ncbi:MAG: DUF1700 domain-containing protein [Caulobacter sp.]|jgi:uncharacterized membrane protein
MTRAEFLERLRKGLAGATPAEREDILADYEAHFAEAAAAGRSEAEAAAALGDPDRLARELRTESGLRRWEEAKSPTSAMGAIAALVGLGAIDILILLPILMSLASTIFALFIALIAVLFAGGATIVVGPFVDHVGGPWTAVLAGVGLVAGATSGGALLTLLCVGLVNALVWYGRLHFKLLKPALDGRI